MKKNEKMENNSGPTLNSVGSFEFDSFCTDHPDVSQKRAIEIILNQLREKINERDRFKNIYVLDGRTGSGKSTLFISELFKTFKKKILVAEPRIVLTRNNTFDIIQRNSFFSLKQNIGYKNSTENQSPEDDISVTFMTTQLLVNQLQTYYQFFGTLQDQIFVIIDEAHLLDIQTLDLLREVKRFLNKYGKEKFCPLFILQSATIRVKEVSKYYFPTEYEEFRKDWKSIGHVKGLSNFKVVERFVENDQMKKMITMEYERKSPAHIISSYYLKFKEQTINSFFSGSSGSSFENSSGQTDSNHSENQSGQTENHSEESKENQKRIGKRFVHLIFLPYVRGIIEFGSVVVNTLTEKQYAVHMIQSSESTKDLYDWRFKNNGKRLIIVPISRGYSSQACDALLDGIDHPKDEQNESLLFVATNVIETGKTIKNLTFALDCGFDTVSCFNPLMFDIKNYGHVIRQVPESKAKAIQRLGRVGRECPGEFLHFMTEGTYRQLDDYEPPDTINSYCISKQLLDIAWFGSLWKQFDFQASNIYMIKFTSDILINSCADLIRAGFLTPFSEIVDFGVVPYSKDYKFFYLIRWLHYIKHLKIDDAVFMAAINERDQNMYLATDFRDYRFKRIEDMDENKLTADVVLSLRKANNTLMKIKYDLSCVIVKNIL